MNNFPNSRKRTYSSISQVKLNSTRTTQRSAVFLNSFKNTSTRYRRFYELLCNTSACNFGPKHQNPCWSFTAWAIKIVNSLLQKRYLTQVGKTCRLLAGVNTIITSIVVQSCKVTHASHVFPSALWLLQYLWPFPVLPFPCFLVALLLLNLAQNSPPLPWIKVHSILVHAVALYSWLLFT